MSEQKSLHELLDHLHDELERARVLDAEETSLLRHVNDDVERLLSRSDGSTISRDESVFARLQESVTQLEAEHPTLGVAVQKVLDVLAESGI